MTDARAISAQLVDIRNVGTHKVVKLTIHAPEEHAMRIMELFGWPTGVNPVPVAIARLVNEPSGSAEGGRLTKEVTTGATLVTAAIPSPTPPPPTVLRNKAGEAERRDWNTLPYSQRAGIRCEEPIFRAFLREMCGKQLAVTAAGAAIAIREICEVESRGDIRKGTEAEKKWLEIESWFAAWQTKERAMA